MTNSAIEQAEAHLATYQRRRLADKVWARGRQLHARPALSAEDTAATPAELGLRAIQDGQAQRSGSAAGYIVLMALGVLLATVLLIFRAPLWQVVTSLPWWAWLGAGLMLLACAVGGRS